MAPLASHRPPRDDDRPFAGRPLHIYGHSDETRDTKPTEHDVLVNFYKTTRPFGFWKPLQHVLSEDVKAKMRKEHRNDLLSIPFVMTWLVTMFLMPMQLIIKQYSAFLITLSLFIISVVFIYIFWYRNLPDKDTVNLQQMAREAK